MAQSVVVMAFRKRLKKRGYTEIRIERLDTGKYMVRALEPLAGFGVQVEMDEIDMAGAMRV